MTPEARLSAAIEIVDMIIHAADTNGPSGDAVVSSYFKTRRYAGSKDRRAVRDLVWAAVRRFGNVPETARSAYLAMADEDADMAALFTGQGHAPAPIADDEARATGGTFPDWIAVYLATPEGGIDTDALLGRAPLDVRINTLKVYVQSIAAGWPEAERLAEAPNALRLPTGQSVEGHADFLSGHLEIQDYGSQLIALSCTAKPGMTALDLCAGAGGKTLALAADMRGEGRLIAADTSRARLGELPKRAARAGATIETRLLNGGQERAELTELRDACDIVLIDAPCSGTGTWRRNPETRWRLTPDRLTQLVSTQAMLLDLGAELVRSGGVLVYAVCALTEAEGRGQIADFLARNAAFTPDAMPFTAGRDYGAGRILTPCHDGSDGFYLARLKRIG